MTAAREGRGTRFTSIGIMVGALALAAFLWFSNRPRSEVAAGLIPEASAPFGPVRRAELVFRWALPSDRSPVRVEILDALASQVPVWTSEAVSGDSLRPATNLVDGWPAADLLWRPVAVPPSGPARPGELAAFTLLP